MVHHTVANMVVATEAMAVMVATDMAVKLYPNTTHPHRDVNQFSITSKPDFQTKTDLKQLCI